MVVFSWIVPGIVAPALGFEGECPRSYTASMTSFQLSARALLDTVQAARELLGCTLVRCQGASVRRARIVETEAYLHDDPASHSFRGLSRRNAAMFGPPGRAYVYRIHRATCFNVVTGPQDLGEAVLIRAVEPLEGLELMELARRRGTVGSTAPIGLALTNGPGKLCQALGISLADDGYDLLRGPVCASRNGRASWLALEPRPSRRRVPVECATRIGISKAREAPLRFFIADNPWVSVRRRSAPADAVSG